MTTDRVMQRYVSVLVMILAFALGGCGGGDGGDTGVGGSVGARVSLSGRTIDDAAWSLDEQRGHWVVVAFQAEWCVPCRAEVKELKTLLADDPEVRVVTVGFAATDEESRKFATSTGITWPVMADPTGKLSERWKVVSLPSTVIVDPDGRVAERYVGGLTAKRMAARIAQAD